MSRDTSVGLLVKDGEVRWTSARIVRGNPVAGQSAKAELKDVDESVSLGTALDEQTSAALSAQIKSTCKRASGEVAAALSSENVLLRVIDLPTGDPEELAGMASFQADKFSPFPAESTVSSYELLSQTETSSHLLVAVCQRKIAEAAGVVLKAAGILPKHIDVDILGRYRTLKDSGLILDQGCQITLLRGGSSCDLLATNDGQPAAIRFLGYNDEMTDEDMVSEIEYTLTTLEADQSITKIDRITILHGSDYDSSNLAALVRDGLDTELQSESLSDLPPLSEGLVRRALDRSNPPIDLSLPEWLDDEKRVKMRSQLLTVTVMLFLVWAGLVGALFGAVHYEKAQIARLKARQESLEKPSIEARETRDLLMMTEQYTNRTLSALECLREATILKPAAMEFTMFKYGGDEKKQVVIQGSASAANNILDFENSLLKSRLFNETKLLGPKEQRDKYVFTITLTLPEAVE